MLLQFGGSLHAVDSEGLTPAMWACYFDQLHNLQVLHDALCRLDPQEDAIFKDTDCYGQSVIHWSVKGAGSLECLEVFDKEMMRDEMVFAWHVFKKCYKDVVETQLSRPTESIGSVLKGQNRHKACVQSACA